MKTWTFLFASYLTLIAINSFGQIKKSVGIEYLLPDTVKTKIQEAMRTDKPSASHYLIWSTNNDTTSLMVSPYSHSGLEYQLIKNSNHFVTLTEKQIIPLVMGSDFQFSTMFHKIKNKGKENETMNVTNFGISGYLIEFTGTYYNAKLIKFEYYTN